MGAAKAMPTGNGSATSADEATTTGATNMARADAKKVFECIVFLPPVPGFTPVLDEEKASRRFLWRL